MAGILPGVSKVGNKVGDEIRKERESRGWSLEDFAAASGVDRVTLNRIELGKQKPHKSTLRNITRAFGDAPRPQESGHADKTDTASTTARLAADLRELFKQIEALAPQQRSQFIRGLMAVLAATIEHDRRDEGDGATGKDGRQPDRSR